MAYKRELISTNQPIQLLDKSKYPVTKTINGVTYTNNGDGIVTVSGATTRSSSYTLIDHVGIVGHKYLVCGGPVGGSFNTYRLTATIYKDRIYVDGFSDAGDGNISMVLEADEEISIVIDIVNISDANLVFKPQLFDLTATFGAGNEPSTVAEFKAKFPNDLYDYRTSNSLTSYKKLLKVSDVCQLLDKREYINTPTSKGITFTNNGDGTITINGTATAWAAFQTSAKFNIFLGHKYLLYPSPTDVNVSLQCGLRNAADVWLAQWLCNSPTVFTLTNENVVTGQFWIGVREGKTVSNVTVSPQAFDLTEMYGAGNEPSTVAEFKAKFPNELYDYSPRCWVKSYKTALIAKTKNLFDYSGKLRQYFDIANGTIIETLPNGAILQGNVGADAGDGGYSNGWFRPGFPDGYGTEVTLSANDTVTISADYEILERNFISPAMVGIHLYGTEELSSPNDSQVETGVLYRVKQTYTITKDGQYYPVFTLNSSKVKITNIQIEKGTTATDYVPYGYL